MRQGVLLLIVLGLLTTACERKGLAPKPTVAALGVEMKVALVSKLFVL
jgi:hypothetical protein